MSHENLLANVVGDLLGWTPEQSKAFYYRLLRLGITDVGGVVAAAREVDREHVGQ